MLKRMQDCRSAVGMWVIERAKLERRRCMSLQCMLMSCGSEIPPITHLGQGVSSPPGGSGMSFRAMLGILGVRPG